jgi:signal peptidase I
MTFPLYVEEGCLFVMGDNRNGSKDSRDPEIGLVDKREVLGKVIFLFLPGTNKGEYPQDFGRIGVID